MVKSSDEPVVPQEIRATAGATLATAQEAVQTCLNEATRFYGVVDDRVQAAQAGARQINRKALSFAQANVEAAFRFARQLVNSTDPKDIATLNKTFLEEQIAQLNMQFKEITEIATQSATAALKQ
jgi:hypothetical protein